jgi:hypothetical protein
MPLSNKITPSLLALTEVSSYKNTDVVKHYAGMNLQRAINSSSKSMALISKAENGEETVRTCVKNMFIGTSMYFDKVLPIRQAEVIAEELLADYDYRQLKLEDILAVCYEIKEADIIKLTPARILRQIKDYCQRRERAVIASAINHSETHKNAGFDNNYDERVKQSIRHIERSNLEIVKTRTAARKFYK